jgi:hypothetical protein
MPTVRARYLIDVVVTGAETEHVRLLHFADFAGS